MQQGQVERVIYVGVAVGGTEVERTFFPRSRRGCAEMLAWARSNGEVARFGMECTGTYGAGAALSTSRASTCRSSS